MTLLFLSFFLHLGLPQCSDTQLFPTQHVKWPEVPLYLFFELSQLARELSHQSDSAVQFLLQRAHLILLIVSFAAHQRHGSHSGEPLQVLLLGGERDRWGVRETVRKVRGIKGCNKADSVGQRHGGSNSVLAADSDMEDLHRHTWSTTVLHPACSRRVNREVLVTGVRCGGLILIIPSEWRLISI